MDKKVRAEQTNLNVRANETANTLNNATNHSLIFTRVAANDISRVDSRSQFARCRISARGREFPFSE